MFLKNKVIINLSPKISHGEKSFLHRCLDANKIEPVIKVSPLKVLEHTTFRLYKIEN